MFAVTEHEDQKYIYQLIFSLCLLWVFFNTQGIILWKEKGIETQHSLWVKAFPTTIHSKV